ncbi:MAG: DUF262 domain-containing protein [Ruminococcus sp.]|jgi:hypothetical protein|nr:DUF262 domain-containing protein [Ruminococcus sp.]
MQSITPEQRKNAENQIKALRKEIDYDTRDYAIDFLVQQYRENEFYIPDEYQRQYIWESQNKNRFIESILLGLPIPFMFFSDADDGRCEIIDGAQRTQTLEEFMNNELKLSDLKKLTTLNGFTYADLPEYFKRKFNKTTMRIVVLSDETTLEIRQEIFNRINTTGIRANPSEIRRGSHAGPFMDFLKECTKNSTFIRVCPVSETSKKRYDDLELVLRFFAFLNNYKNFNHRVDEFLDSYVESVKDSFDQKKFKMEFENMLAFVDKYFENGFKKTKTSKSTPRVRFEAIAVGVGLALRENPSLIPSSMEWLGSEEFKMHTTTHASNSPSRVSGRVEYVRDMLLGGETNAGND